MLTIVNAQNGERVYRFHKSILNCANGTIRMDMLPVYQVVDLDFKAVSHTAKNVKKLCSLHD